LKLSKLRLSVFSIERDGSPRRIGCGFNEVAAWRRNLPDLLRIETLEGCSGSRWLGGRTLPAQAEGGVWPATVYLIKVRWSGRNCR